MERAHGATIVWLPFDLHPEIPDEGIDAERVRARFGGAYLERVGQLAEEAGLPFRPPLRIPRTRRALHLSEWVRRHRPDRFGDLHRDLFDAYWSRGRDLSSQQVLVEIAGVAGIDGDEARAAMDAESSSDTLRASMRAAQEVGVTGTPSWLIGRLLVPGVQPRETFDRIIERMQARGG